MKWVSEMLRTLGIMVVVGTLVVGAFLLFSGMLSGCGWRGAASEVWEVPFTPVLLTAGWEGDARGGMTSVDSGPAYLETGELCGTVTGIGGSYYNPGPGSHEPMVSLFAMPLETSGEGVVLTSSGLDDRREYVSRVLGLEPIGDVATSGSWGELLLLRTEPDAIPEGGWKMVAVLLSEVGGLYVQELHVLVDTGSCERSSP